MRKRRKRRRSVEFSKKALIVQYLISVVLIIIAVVATFTDHDVTGLAALAGASTLCDGAVTGFYFWKAKNENRAKYAQQFVVKFADKYGIDAAIRIAEVVLKD